MLVTAEYYLTIFLNIGQRIMAGITFEVVLISDLYLFYKLFSFILASSAIKFKVIDRLVTFSFYYRLTGQLPSSFLINSSLQTSRGLDVCIHETNTFYGGVCVCVCVC